MGGLFSKKEKSRITDQDRAILGLKKQRDQLKQYQRRIEGVLEKVINDHQRFCSYDASHVLGQRTGQKVIERGKERSRKAAFEKEEISGGLAGSDCRTIGQY